MLFTLLSVVPAWLSWRWVEEPFRASRAIVDRPVRAAVLATVCTVLVVFTATSLLISGQSSARVTVSSAAGVVTINPAAARVDTAKPHHDGCFASKYAMTEAEPCVYGNPDGTRTVALLGDSHALQWFSAVEPIAINEGWRLEVLAKPSCSVSDVDIHSTMLDRTYDECADWRDNAVKALAASKPDVLLVGTSRTYQVVKDGNILGYENSRPLLQDGLKRTYQELEATTGARVVVLADTPTSPKNVPTCLSAGNGTGCDFAPTPEPERMDVQAARQVPGVEVFDIVPVICPDGECRAVNRGTILMLDGSHLTAAFVRTTQGEIRPYLTS